jgi:PqqD family protein of HPr-rel-A system
MTRWSLDPHVELACRRWDAEVVVHHALSNDTHRLAEPAGAILQWLDQSGSQDEAAIALACDADPSDVADVLAALAELNLVSPC